MPIKLSTPNVSETDRLRFLLSAAQAEIRNLGGRIDKHIGACLTSDEEFGPDEDGLYRPLACKLHKIENKLKKLMP